MFYGKPGVRPFPHGWPFNIKSFRPSIRLWPPLQAQLLPIWVVTVLIGQSNTTTTDKLCFNQAWKLSSLTTLRTGEHTCPYNRLKLGSHVDLRCRHGIPPCKMSELDRYSLAVKGQEGLVNHGFIWNTWRELESIIIAKECKYRTSVKVKSDTLCSHNVCTLGYNF